MRQIKMNCGQIDTVISRTIRDLESRAEKAAELISLLTPGTSEYLRAISKWEALESELDGACAVRSSVLAEFKKMEVVL